LFRNNAIGLQLHALVYNLANLMLMIFDQDPLRRMPGKSTTR